MFATAEQTIPQSVAQQLIDRGEVALEAQRLQVKCFAGECFRMVRFQMSGREYDAIAVCLEPRFVSGALARPRPGSAVP